MAFFAVDDDHLIDAWEAIPGKVYWCLDCFGPVKKRKGRRRRERGHFFHFYHLKPSAGCRLYSKSEDHLIAQLELRRLFPQGVLQIERPFIPIDRVADACWEKEKVVFEIQCTSLSEKEAEIRMRDYKSQGYDVIWLLDDKRYNKRVCRPAEAFLRTRSAYYISIRRMEIYDQFEVFFEGKRVRKGRPLPIDLRRIYRAPDTTFCEDRYPQQIVKLQVCRHFYGDRLSKALRFSTSMLQEKAIEDGWKIRKPHPILKWLKKYVADPYVRWLEAQVRRY